MPDMKTDKLNPTVNAANVPSAKKNTPKKIDSFLDMAAALKGPVKITKNPFKMRPPSRGIMGRRFIISMDKLAS